MCLNEVEQDDPALVAEVNEKLGDVKVPFERLHTKVIQRQARLQNIIIQGQDFQLSLREALSTLEEFEHSIAQQEPLSAEYEAVAQQKEDHEVKTFCSFPYKDREDQVLL